MDTCGLDIYIYTLIYIYIYRMDIFLCIFYFLLINSVSPVVVLLIPYLLFAFISATIYPYFRIFLCICTYDKQTHTHTLYESTPPVRTLYLSFCDCPLTSQAFSSFFLLLSIKIYVHIYIYTIHTYVYKIINLAIHSYI